MENKLRTNKYAVVIINTICNLKCKNCITLTPYQKAKINFKTENIIKDIDAFFELFEYVEHLDFEGGETFLHPDIISIIRHALTHKDKFKRIHILTNATIIPPKELLNICKNENVFFVIGDYGENLSLKKHEVQQLLEEYGIEYRTDVYHGKNQYFNGWIDFGDFKCKNRTHEELMSIASLCWQSQNIPRIRDGKVFKCTIQMGGRVFNYIPLLDCEFIDLHNKKFSLNDKIKLWKAITENPVTMCNYCNGFIVDGPRIAGAKQLGPKELTV